VAPPGGPPDRTLERFRERLELTPEQTEKARVILGEARQKEEEARQKTDARIREILTDAQRPKFDELQKSRDAGGPRPGGTHNRWMGPSPEDLQRELDLAPEQREKIGALIESAADAVRKRFEEARAGNFQGVDWGAVRTEAERLFTETSEKVKAILTPEQQVRYAKLIEERNRLVQNVFRRTETPADRVARSMEALKIKDPDEATAVKALVTRVVKLQGDLADADRGARDRARDLLKAEDAKDEILQERLGAQRKDRRALEDQLLKAQKELGEVVTVRQELELIQLGILR
jgi:Spy/CpxP family protein refolding chaperone